MTRRDRYRCHLQRNEAGRLTGVTITAEPADMATRTVRVSEQLLPAMLEPLRQVLREGGVHGRAWTGSAPLDLDHRVGSQVELLLAAVSPLRRRDRASAVAMGVAAMSAEEAAYWHARAYRPGGLVALRTLLAAEGDRWFAA